MDRYVVIDLETTGHSPQKGDKIIEVGIAVIEGDEITDHFATLLNPNQSIPPFISGLTGINDEDVLDAPSFEERAEDIAAMFEDAYLIAHNVPFDLGFLNAELVRVGRQPLKNPVVDTVELARILYPLAPGYKLGQLAEYLELSHDDPHRALSDAHVTAEIFIRLKEKLSLLPYETITQLQKLEKLFKSDLSMFLLELEEDLSFAIKERADIDTYGGLAFRKFEMEKKPLQEITLSYGDYLDSIYEAEGTMEAKMAKYEKRDGQRKMSETIYDAFQMSHHALIEAETGTGKSLAYLIPAIYEAVQSNKRVIISTHTTQLQTQLLDEEIPMIRELVPVPFQAALLKGKGHYISLEKFEQELSDPDQNNYDTALTKAKLLVWLTETETGDIDEIQLPSSGYFFFKKISTEAEGRVDPQSPWFKYSYYQHARRKAQQADIIITNHSLLCTDIFNDYQFLPTYDKLIIDEAHHLEETASRHYGLKLDYVSMQYAFNQLGASNDSGALNKIVSGYSYELDDLPLENWNHILSQCKYEMDDLFRTLFQYVVDQKRKDKSLSDTGRIQYRFDQGDQEPERWETIKEMANRLIFYLRDLIHILSMIEAYFHSKGLLEKQDEDEISKQVQLLQSFIDRIEHLFIHAEQVDTSVKWMEVEAYGAKNAVYLYSEPMDMSKLLADDFFEKKQSVILTSATLTMRNSFTFIRDRLGVPEERLISEKITSPFSYADQVQLLIPDDFPDIKYGNVDEFVYATCEAILSLAEITDGRMLVLFTSYEMLRKAHAVLKENMDNQDYVIIAQGISSGSRSRLKKNFQTYNQAILLGTSSFWEGVDIPGEDLSCLMIVRLPFQPPDHPVYQAKADYLQQSGKNAFFDLALPNAVIRFKQGFGRLIRSTSDRGIVFVCDARIKKSRYGRFFTQSIPEVPITYDSTGRLLEKAEEWF
ncbi:ATP-dependent DNA helicase DinG [Virgibacillus xinjiangensis]|uniref:3'-5' exonuclease DinG n=1 Tax=Virgibacillus xinjiangensis TaxID=393090 RepID=A0ABV7CR72_9BACI